MDPASTRWRILWFDASAGLVAGIILLGLHSYWASLTGLPPWLLIFQGCANLVYSGFAFFLAAGLRRPWQLMLLIKGNLAYAGLALILLIVFFPVCTAWGIGLFVAEVLFVGGLGLLEWRWLAG